MSFYCKDCGKEFYPKYLCTCLGSSIPSPSPSEPQHFLNEDKLDEFRKKLREGYKWDCTVETFDQCTKTHCYICPHVKEIPPFYPEVAQQPEPQPLEPLIKQINDIIYKIAPKLKIKQQVQMRIEIMQAITAHEQEAIKQFAEKCIEGMPKAESKCDYDQDLWDVAIECQRNDDIAHIRAMAKEAK